QGEVPRRAFIVRDGVIRAYTITSSGEERVVALYGRGDIFPLTWLLGETTNTLFYYDAVSEARLLSASKENFLNATTKTTEGLTQMLRFVGNQYTSLLLRITGLEQSRAVEKIGFTLYYLLFRYGHETTPGVYTVNVKLSQLMIANLVGLTRESSTKNLKILRDKGIIDYQSSIYTIDKLKLEQFLGEDSFRDIAI
ncbi:MAG TPA: Crp/Fnr family transcriptional regulator, partial [Candidatus Saccharimonadales bacterium]